MANHWLDYFKSTFTFYTAALEQLASLVATGAIFDYNDLDINSLTVELLNDSKTFCFGVKIGSRKETNIKKIRAAIKHILTTSNLGSLTSSQIQKIEGLRHQNLI